MRFERLMFDITLQFATAWNEGDFITLENCMAEQVEYESPLVSPLAPEYPDNRIIGRANLMAYFRKAFLRKPGIVLDTDTIQTTKELREIQLQSHLVGLDKVLLARLILNEYGKLISLKINYTDKY